MNKFIVTTTIYPPLEATIKFAGMKDWTFIIVGDLKTPHQEYYNWIRNERLDNVVYLHPGYQTEEYPELSEAIGWNKIMRRNIGFIEAYRRGADIVASIDDDNIPYDSWGKTILVGETLSDLTDSVKCYDTSDICIDPMKLTNHKELWHRGFPLEGLRSNHDLTSVKPASSKILIQANLWDGDPDVDAVCRKMYNPKGLELELDSPFTTIPYAPFNSQNTFIAREVLPHYMCIPHIGRMDDIWGGYIAQYLLNTRAVFMPPTVRQDRNEHSLNKDFTDEVLGYTTTYQLLQDIENWEKYLPEQALKAFNLYRREYNGK